VLFRAEGGAETSCARRGTKRRGGRGGRRNARKRRRLVTAAPDSYSHPPRQGSVLSRRSYLLERRVKWEKKRFEVIGVLNKLLSRSKDPTPKGVARRKALRSDVKRITAGLVDVMSRSSGDSREFCLIKAQTYIRIMHMGWMAMGATDLDYQYGPNSHFQPPPMSLTKVGKWSARLHDDEGTPRVKFSYTSPPESLRRRRGKQAVRSESTSKGPPNEQLTVYPDRKKKGRPAKKAYKPICSAPGVPRCPKCGKVPGPFGCPARAGGCT
jgi:hypothetical protein